MKCSLRTSAIAGLFLAISAWFPFDLNQETLSKDGLKSLISKFCYEPKDIGNGNYEITINKSDFNVPVSISLSKSEQKLWFVANLGEQKPERTANADRLRVLLETNAQIQPVFFYLQAGLLKLGKAIDNRSLTPALVRRELDLFVDAVVDSRDAWN